MKKNHPAIILLVFAIAIFFVLPPLNAHLAKRNRFRALVDMLQGEYGAKCLNIDYQNKQIEIVDLSESSLSQDEFGMILGLAEFAKIDCVIVCEDQNLSIEKIAHPICEVGKIKTEK